MCIRDSTLAGDQAAHGASGAAILTAWGISGVGVFCLVMTFFGLSRVKPELKMCIRDSIRVVPKPVVAMVNGYAIGGGHVLHILCDLSIAAETAKFGQTGPKVGSFDAGYGAGYLAAIVGQKLSLIHI